MNGFPPHLPVADRVRASSTPVREARRWWEERFAGVVPAEPTSTSFGRSRVASGPRARHVVPLADRARARLAALVGTSRLRLSGVLATAAGIVSMRHARRDDLLVVVAAGDDLVPVHVVTVDGEEAGSLVERVAEVIRQASAVVTALPPEVPESVLSAHASAIAVAVEQPGRQAVDAEVCLIGELHDGSVRLVIDVDSGRIVPDLAGRVARHLAVVCGLLAEQPGTLVDDVELLDAEERAEVLALANAAAAPSAAVPLHQRVERFAGTHPDRVAVVHGDRRLTYEQLRRAALAVAGRLADAGVREGDRIAILLARGESPVVAVLAAFAVGAVYVPLDAAYPDDRLRFMVDDCGARAVVTEPALADRLPVLPDRPVVVLEDPWSATAPAGGARLAGSADPDAPAYAIYTSGTTGRPKAAVISHRAYAATCAAYGEVYALSEDEPPVCLQLGSFAFDVFNGDLGRSLYYGGTLVICPDEVRADVREVARLIAAHDVSVLESTPALINPLAEQLAGVSGSLRVLISSADAWRGRDHHRVANVLDPAVRVFNTYGVTEAAIDSTACRPDPSSTADVAYVPIGKPFSHVRAYVLDERLRLVPRGAVGELCIGGSSVADGYLERDALTAERFVPDSIGGGRLYRTGDLVRHLPSGDLEYLGRNDHQVQIRGFRVELGEVEAVLRSHADVREVVAVDFEDDGSRGVAAYVVHSGRAPSVGDLRAHCLRQLPVHMVPVAFYSLPTIPLSRNGKVDRKALPGAGVAPLSATVAHVAPRTSVERLIAAVWEEVLDVRPVGVHDDFFDLGGQSLSAARTMARVQQACGVELGLRALFDAPTVAALSALVSAAAPATGLAPRRADHSPTDPVRASAAQSRLWFTEQWRQGTAANNIPIVLDLRGPLDVDALRRALDATITRHEALRTRFEVVDGEPWQRDTGLSAFPLQFADLSGAADGDVTRHAAVRAVVERPFDLERGPLVRGLLARLDHDRHVLAIAVHHMVADGWSIGLLLAQWRDRYEAAVAGREVPPDSTTLRYTDFTQWHAERLTDEVVAGHVAFWRGRLDGVEDLALPWDRPRGVHGNGGGDAIDFLVPSDLMARLTAFATERGATAYMVLMAAFQVWLGRWSGQDRFAVGTVTAGRPHPALEEVVGFFVNTLPVPADLSGTPAFEDVVERVRVEVLDAFAHQEVPFDRVVAELDLPRTPGTTPVFQVCLALDNGGAVLDRLGAVEVREVAFPVRHSRFDLTLELSTRDGGMVGGLTYATDLFDRSTAERMLRGFRRVLDEVMADPTRPVAHIPLLDAAEEADLARWGTGPVRSPGGQSLHAPIEEQARLNPSATAVVSADRTTTFAELDAAADDLASRLVHAGAGPDAVVAVCLPRSVELVVALLAVLKSGAAYLPVETDLPDERTDFLLRDSRAVVTIASGGDTARIHALGHPVLAVDGGAGAPSSRVASRSPHPDSAAYVIYTSGSTGAPKGVVVSHSAIDNRLRWAQATYGLDKTDRVLHKTPIGFDVSVWELFWPLREGVPLVLAEPEGHRDPRYLARLIERERITTVHFVPPMLDAFLREPDAARCGGVLRRVLCSGEALSPELAARFTRQWDVELHNLYGPTEAAVDVTSWACPSVAPARVPIGRPVWNTGVQVLDADLQRVPVGVPGQLYLTGAQLARCYLNRPGLTAEHFLPDPHGRPGTRMYRTGDIARWSADGQLEYLGRVDSQVKVRGQRVELGEVEAALDRHPAVAAASVGTSGEGGDTRLIAYVVPDPSAASPVARRLRHERSSDGLDLRWHSLPNGLGVTGPGRAEVEFLYREIFEGREYLGHGIALPDDAVVFDVGAHIGMFSLLVSRMRPGSSVYAFEPIPELFDWLSVNVDVHGVRARLFNVGLGAAGGEAVFRYYPGLSILSGRYADEARDRAAVEAHLRALGEADAVDAGRGRDLLDELLDDRLQGREVRCRIRTVSEVIDEHDVARVDLLKIDAERSEWEVLSGVEERHWGRIRQVVAEVHEDGDRVGRVVALLRDKGFQVSTGTASSLTGSGMVNVFAVRSAPPQAVVTSVADDRQGQWADLAPWKSDIREALERSLPRHMVPSVIVPVVELPLTRNGKVDRRALAKLGAGAGSGTVPFAPPTSESERVVAEVWALALGVDRIGRHDDFFAAGGHSLLATRALAAIEAKFGVRLAVRDLFEAPTVVAFAEVVDAARSSSGPTAPALRPRDRSGYRLA